MTDEINATLYALVLDGSDDALRVAMDLCEGYGLILPDLTTTLTTFRMPIGYISTTGDSILHMYTMYGFSASITGDRRMRTSQHSQTHHGWASLSGMWSYYVSRDERL